ncbi:hypothetical protein K438DRAFT_1782329 [Mycena galopus ATCC 62051]|nr:hypothetical protein K438DRAFT_1782329 [Mycena galopus ATCC 62051]
MSSSDPSSEQIESGPAPEPTPEVAAAQAVAAQLARDTLTDPKSKKWWSIKNSGDDEDAEISASYKDYGRAFLRLGDAFTPVDDIVQHGTFVETMEEIDYPEMDDKLSLALFPTFILTYFLELTRPILPGSDDSAEEALQASSSSLFSGSRGEDANTLKKAVLDYLIVDPAVALDPPIPRNSKVTRGYNHTVTARLLSGTIKVTGCTFLRFFYPDEWVYEKDHLMDDLFEGHLMIRGLSQALKPPGAHRGNRGNAAKIGARVITPRIMAYIAVQTVFSISSLDVWQQIDGNFDYEQFYWMIVSLFDDGDNADVLQKFNHHVFGDTSGRPTKITPSGEGECDKDEDDLEAYQALRAAKKARLEAENTGDGASGAGS